MQEVESREKAQDRQASAHEDTKDMTEVAGERQQAEEPPEGKS